MRNLLLITMIALFSVSASYGQERVVTGKVTEADTGGPIPGANVVVKGTSTGTVTDLDGMYSLPFSEENAILTFSFVGFVTEEVAVGSQSVIDVSLKSDVTALSEVVVIGYGTQEKKEITSAVASVGEEDFNVGNVQDAAQLIQGKVAGLTIVRAGSNPNDGFAIRMRGLSTFNSNNTGPLIVVDGMIGADLRNVDPNDIESMDVLKDASAGAIYGTRGANGVIIVTTKKGNKGTSKVDYNGYVSAESPFRLPDVMSADEWRSFRSELEGQGIPVSQDLGASTDWFDELTRTAYSQVHNLAVSGGSDKTNYRVSMNYRDINGISEPSGFERYNTRINLTHKALNDKLTLGANIGGSLNKATYANNGAFRHASIFNPTAPVKSDDPRYDEFGGYYQLEGSFDYFNPVALQKQTIANGTDKRINIQLKGDYEIFDNLVFDVAYSFQTQTELRNNYESKQSFGGGINRNGLATKESKDFYNQLLESTLRWSGDIGNGTIDAVGGYSYQEFYDEGFRAQGGDFISDAYTYNRLKASNDFNTGIGDVTSFKNSNKLIAFFGRVNLSWDQTWFLSVSGRREGSSKFGDGKKWGFFPGVSGGVELANIINSSSINNLKFRVSYGEAGNNLKDSYLSLVVAEPGDDSFYYDGNYVKGYGPLRNSNPELGWESKKEVNIGIDYAFFNDKIYGAIDYYTRKTESLLWQFGVPQPPNLANKTWTNVGDLRNSGLEFLINYKAVDKSAFSYTPTLTATWYIENEVVSMSDPENGFLFGAGTAYGNMGSPGQNGTPLAWLEEGKPLGQLWGWKYVGISEGGELIREDISGPEDVPDGSVDDYDRTVIGNGLPEFELGFGNSFRWKNWDANVFFRGVFGHELINSMRGFYELPSAIRSYNVMRTARDMKNPDTGIYLKTPDGKLTDLYVEKGDYLKLENLSVGYNFNMPSGSSFSSIRVYFAANNLFVLTGYKGSDPEVRYGDSEDSNNPLVTGVDRRDTWYLTRSMSLGVSLGFK